MIPGREAKCEPQMSLVVLEPCTGRGSVIIPTHYSLRGPHVPLCFWVFLYPEASSGDRSPLTPGSGSSYPA